MNGYWAKVEGDNPVSFICHPCFYESEIVKRRDRRQSSRIVLVQVASGILLWTNGEMSRKRFMNELTLAHTTVSGCVSETVLAAS
jgi:hypothetical protein